MGPVVTFARKVDPFGVSEFIAHKIEVAVVGGGGVMRRAILWRAMPRSTMRLLALVCMLKYISLSMSSKMKVFPPTRAWSWDSR